MQPGRILFAMPVLGILLLSAVLLPGRADAQAFDFSWDQATIYRIVTDRFSNGDSSNDFAYGRGLNGEGSPYDRDSTGHFLGGDYAGLIGWIEEGYFSDLGVNALWMSAPYEQVHGWTGGGDGDFQQYGYDGTWPMDFTHHERAFGEEDDIAALRTAADESGLRLVMDVDLNHVGPATMHDMAAFNYGGLTGEGWRAWTPASRVGWQSYQSDLVALEDSVDAWGRWWGPDWVRADLPGYEACGEVTATACVNQLPDLRSDVAVSGLPSFLTLKWGEAGTAAQQAELDAFFQRNGATRSASAHVIKWVTDWVASGLMDGLHVRETAHIDRAILDLFIQEVAHAWSMVGSGDTEQDPFLVLLDEPVADLPAVEGVVVTWIQEGEQADVASLTDVVRETATSGQAVHVRSIADDVAGDAASIRSFLLSPGPLVITYGQETGRNPGPDVSEPIHQHQSIMDWGSVDEARLALWSQIGSFRGRHPAVATGGFDELQTGPYAFHRGVRLGAETDQIVIVEGAQQKTRVKVSLVWPDDTVLRDVMTGSIAFVSYGEVSFTPHESGLMLLEEVTE